MPFPASTRSNQKFGSLWERHAQDFKTAFFLLPTCFSYPAARDVLSHQQFDRANSLRFRFTRNVAGIQVQWDSSCYRLKSASFEDAFDSLVLSTPASAAAEIVDPVSSEAARDLRQIPYFSTVIVYLAYKRGEFAHPLKGHGFVVPRKEATVIDALHLGQQ